MPWLLRMELPGTVKPPDTSSASPSEKVTRRKSGVTVTNSSTNTTGFFDPSTFGLQQDYQQQQQQSSYVIPTISNSKKWIHPSQLRSSNVLGIGGGGEPRVTTNLMMMDMSQRGMNPQNATKLRLSDQLNRKHSPHLITSDLNYDAIDTLNEMKLNNDHLNDHGQYSLYHNPSSPTSYPSSSLHRLNPHRVHPSTISSSASALHQMQHSSNNLHTDCPFPNCPHTHSDSSNSAAAQVLMINSGQQQIIDDEGNSDVDSTCHQINSTNNMGMNNSNLLIPPPPLQSNLNNLCSCDSCPINCLQPLIQSSTNSEEISAILQEMKFLTNRLRREDEVGDIVNEWRGAAMVIDRLCLILFTAFTIMSTLICITSAPHLVVHG